MLSPSDTTARTRIHVLCGLRQSVLSNSTQVTLGLLSAGSPHQAISGVTITGDTKPHTPYEAKFVSRPAWGAMGTQRMTG